MLNELRALLDRNLEAARSGQKTTADGTGTAFELYCNEVAYTNNIILVHAAGQPCELYTTLDNPNFIKTTDPRLCNQAKDWLDHIQQASVQVYR
ncbi:MAG TPA: hypothetical protein PKD78_15115 [Saprospiraceae bacterium]|nr:hypothetical protein [Saprospiraceae bacterium]HNC91785.1 hypothetical protein [Anaerolineales bacterium]